MKKTVRGLLGDKYHHFRYVEGEGELELGYYPQDEVSLTQEQISGLTLVAKLDMNMYTLRVFSDGASLLCTWSNEGHYYRYMPIRWIILKKEGSNALILSKHIVERKCFDAKNNEYAGSILAEMLQNVFLQFAGLEGFKRILPYPGLEGVHIALPSKKMLVDSNVMNANFTDFTKRITWCEIPAYWLIDASDKAPEVDTVYHKVDPGCHVSDDNEWLYDVSEVAEEICTYYRCEANLETQSFDECKDFEFLGVRPCLWVNLR